MGHVAAVCRGEDEEETFSVSYICTLLNFKVVVKECGWGHA